MARNNDNGKFEIELIPKLNITKSIKNLNEEIKKLEEHPQLRKLHLDATISKAGLKRIREQLRTEEFKIRISEITANKGALGLLRKQIKDFLRESKFQIKIDDVKVKVDSAVSDEEIKLLKQSIQSELKKHTFYVNVEALNAVEIKNITVNKEALDRLKSQIKEEVDNLVFKIKIKPEFDKSEMDIGDFDVPDRTKKKVKKQGEDLGEGIKDGFKEGIKRGSTEDAKKIYKEFEKVSTDIDDQFSKNAIITTIDFFDGKGNLQGFIVEGEEANGVVKKLSYSFKELKDDAEESSRIPILNSITKIDKQEKVLDSFRDKFDEIIRKVIKLGDEGKDLWVELSNAQNPADLKNIEKKIKLTNDHIGKNKELLDIENKRRSLMTKLQTDFANGFVKEGTLNEILPKITNGDLSNLKKAESILENHVKLEKAKRKEGELHQKALTENEKRDKKAREERIQSIIKHRENLDLLGRVRDKVGEEIFSERQFNALTEALDFRKIKSLEQQKTIEKQILNILQDQRDARETRSVDRYREKLIKDLEKIQALYSNAPQGNGRELYQQKRNQLKTHLLTLQTKDDLDAFFDRKLSKLIASAERKIEQRKTGTNLLEERDGQGNLVLDREQRTRFEDIMKMGDPREQQEALKEFIKEVKDLDFSFVKVKQSVGKAGQTVYEFVGELQKGKKTVDQTTFSVDTMNRSLNEGMTQIKNNPNKNLGVLEQFKIAMARVPVWMAAMTAFYGVGQSLSSMVGIIVEVDTAMTELKRVMSAETDFNAMLEESISLSKELGNNLADVNQALIGFARQGFKGQDALDMTRTAILASNVSELTADESMENITAIMTQFNIEASESIQIVDKLNEVDNNFAITTKNLSDALSKAGATAQTYGVTIDEMVGYVTAIGVATRESGKTVGNSLKTIFSRLTSMSGSVNALEEIGIHVYDANGALKSSTEVLDELHGKWGSLSAEQQQNIAVQAAGRYQLSRFLAMMNNYEMALGATETALHSQGSAMRENLEYQKSLQARINTLKTTYQEMALAFGEDFLTDSFKGVLDSLTSLANMGKTLADNFSILGIAFGVLGASFILLSTRAKVWIIDLTKIIFLQKRLAISTELLSQAFVGLKNNWRELLVSGGVTAVFVLLGVLLDQVISKIVAYNDRQQELARKNAITSDSIENQGQKIDELTARMKELEAVKASSEGFNSEQEEEYKKIQVELAQLLPSVATGINDKGQAIVEESNILEQNIKLMREKLELEREQRKNDLPESVSSTNKQIEKKRKELEELQARIDEMSNSNLDGGDQFAYLQEENQRAHDKKFTKWGLNWNVFGLDFNPFDSKYEDFQSMLNDLQQTALDYQMEINKLENDKIGLYEELISKANALTQEDREWLAQQTEKKGYTKSAIADMEKQAKVLSDMRMATGDIFKREDVDKLSEEQKRVMHIIAKSMENGYTQWLETENGKESPMKKLIEQTFGVDAKAILERLSAGLEDVEGSAEGLNKEFEDGIDTWKTMTGIESDRVDQLKELVSMYEFLSNAEGLSQVDKERLKAVTDELIGSELNLSDAKSITAGAMREEIENLETLQEGVSQSVEGQIDAEGRLTVAKALNVRKRIEMNNAEIQSYMDTMETLQDVAIYVDMSQKMKDVQKENEELRKEYKKLIETIKEELEEVDALNKLIEEQAKVIDQLRNELQDLENVRNDYREGSEEYRKAIQAEIDKHKELIDKYKEQKNELKTMPKAVSTSVIVDEGQVPKFKRSNIESSKVDFVNEIMPHILKASQETNLLPSVMLAQTIQETGWGNHRVGNNIFGIKADKNWKGKTQKAWTSEYVGNGKYTSVEAKFRDYDSILESILDYTKFIQGSNYDDVRSAKTYKEAVAGLVNTDNGDKAYATDGNYAKNLLNIIEKNNLNIYDKLVKEGIVVKEIKNGIPKDVADYYLSLDEVHPKGVFDPEGDLRGRPHNGHDFNLNADRDLKKPVLALAEGVIKSVGQQKNSAGELTGAGNYITVKHLDGTISKYFHLFENMANSFKVGQKVTAGQQIGRIGNTGTSSGAHLHMETIAKDGTHVNPLEFIKGQQTEVVSNAIAKTGDEDEREAEIAEKDAQISELYEKIEQLNTALVNDYFTQFEKNVEEIDADIKTSETNMKGLVEGSSNYNEELDKQISLEKDKIEEYKTGISTIEKEISTRNDLTDAQREIIEDGRKALEQQILEAQVKISELSYEKVNGSIANYQDSMEDINTQYELSKLLMDDMVVGSEAYEKELDFQLAKLKEKKAIEEQILELLILQLKNNPDLSESAKNDLELKILQQRLKIKEEESKIEDESWKKYESGMTSYSDNLDDISDRLGLADQALGAYNEESSEYQAVEKEKLSLMQQEIAQLIDQERYMREYLATQSLAPKKERELKEAIEDVVTSIKQKEIALIDFRQSVYDRMDGILQEAKEKAIAHIEEEGEAKRERVERDRDRAIDAIEDEMDSLERAHEKKMDMYDEEEERINDLTDAKIESLRREQRERDHDNQIDELYDDRAELQEEYDKYLLDSTQQGEIKRQELREQIAQIDKQIDNEQYNHKIDLAEDALNDQRDLLLDEVAKKREAETDMYEEKRRSLEKQREATEEHYEHLARMADDWVKDEKKRIEKMEMDQKNAFESIKAFIEANMELIGESIAKNMIAKLEEAKKILMSLQGVDFSGSGLADISTALSSITSGGTAIPQGTSSANSTHADYGFNYDPSYDDLFAVSNPLESGSNSNVFTLEDFLAFDTGGFTGNSEGLAMLHEKELVLNQKDTSNILKAVEAIRNINLGNIFGKLRIPEMKNGNVHPEGKIADVNVNVHIDEVTGGQQGFDEIMKKISTTLKGKGVAFKL